nr:MAG TPA: tail protein [Caudoviricetes sp.]
MPIETTAALRVDLLDPGAPQIIHAVQDDSNSRKIAFNIYAGGAQWAVPDGTLVTVRYKKPDGTAGFYDTLPDGSTPAATIDGNVVTVALVPQAFTVRGNVPVQIKLYDSAGTSIATFAVVMHVSANVVSDAEIVSSDYYSVLTKQIADVLAAAEGIDGNVTAAQEAARQAASSASAASGSATAAASSASTASTAAGQAQTAATNAGTSETNAATSASDAEGAKTAAETAASNASGDAAAAESAKTAAQTAATNAENAAAPVLAILSSGAGAHNSIYRGKNLGTSVTAAQWAAIADGSFTDLYIGDYWVIGGVTYRIAAFDYYLQTGDTPCTDHHVTLIPDTPMYTHAMNETDTTVGGYVGSKMYTEGLTPAKTTIASAFGSAHILTHRQYLPNAVTDGYPSGGAWYDSTVELMTEQNVYGGKIFGVANNGTTIPNLFTLDKSQFPLFAFRPDIISGRSWFWLRDVVSAYGFADVFDTGLANSDRSIYAGGVRPAFSIIG